MAGAARRGRVTKARRPRAGQILLFLDADTWFEPDGLARVLAEFQTAGGGAFSVAPYHAVRDFHEQFSAFFNLVMLAGTELLQCSATGIRSVVCSGRCLLVDRESLPARRRTRSRRRAGFSKTSGWRGSFVKRASRCESVAGAACFHFACIRRLARVDSRLDKGFASGAGQTPRGILFLIIVVDGRADLCADWWLATGDCRCWGGGLSALRGAGGLVLAGWWEHFAGTRRCSIRCRIFFFAVFAWSVVRSGKTGQLERTEIRAD